MAKKPTLSQRNATKLNDLLKQKVSSGSKGFIKADLKRFIAEEMISAANNKKKPIKSTDSLQKRYNSFKPYYDKLFGQGLEGHAFYTGQIEKQSKKDIDKGTEYYIKEKGIEKKVSHSELSYKMELLAHKLSTQHDVAFTKFKPTYYLIGKGKYKVVINIPDIKEIDFDNDTVEEIMETLDSEGLEVVISDPYKFKTKEAKQKYEKAKKERQKRIKKTKEKYYHQWNKGKKKTTKPVQKKSTHSSKSKTIQPRSGKKKRK